MRRWENFGPLQRSKQKARNAQWRYVLLHDNSRPHFAGNTENLIEEFGWEQLDHPTFSPDLASFVYYLFLNLKRYFGGRHFGSDEDVKNGVHQCLSSQAVSFYKDVTEKLFPATVNVWTVVETVWMNILRYAHLCKINFFRYGLFCCCTYFPNTRLWIAFFKCKLTTFFWIF